LLRGVDPRGVDHRGVDLGGVDLRGADLPKVWTSLLILHTLIVAFALQHA
jgi:uncharacterized protein YjbI with pentapeptide repeats